eukprot:gene310-4581_t
MFSRAAHTGALIGGGMGVAAAQGLVDLDAPLASYGVTPRANWSRAGVDWWPRVTARHLLAQSSGYGL